MLFFNPDKFGTRAFRRKRAQEIKGLEIKYITMRIGEEEYVMGRGGSISVDKGKFVLFSSEKVIMSGLVDKLDASFLMSNDGVIMTAPNLEKGGEVETYVAHFVYHRK